MAIGKLIAAWSFESTTHGLVVEQGGVGWIDQGCRASSWIGSQTP